MYNINRHLQFHTPKRGRKLKTTRFRCHRNWAKDSHRLFTWLATTLQMQESPWRWYNWGVCKTWSLVSCSKTNLPASRKFNIRMYSGTLTLTKLQTIVTLSLNSVMVAISKDSSKVKADSTNSKPAKFFFKFYKDSKLFMEQDIFIEIWSQQIFC